MHHNVGICLCLYPRRNLPRWCQKSYAHGLGNSPHRGLAFQLPLTAEIDVYPGLDPLPLNRQVRVIHECFCLTRYRAMGEHAADYMQAVSVLIRVGTKF